MEFKAGQYVDLIDDNTEWKNKPPTNKIKNKKVREAILKNGPTINGPGVFSPTHDYGNITQAFDTVVSYCRNGVYGVLVVVRNRFSEINDERPRYCLAGGGIRDYLVKNLWCVVNFLESKQDGAKREIHEEAVKDKDLANLLVEMSIMVGIFFNVNDPRATEAVVPETTVRAIHLDLDSEEGKFLFGDIESKLEVTDKEEASAVKMMPISEFFKEAHQGNTFAGHEVIYLEALEALTEQGKIPLEAENKIINEYLSYFKNESI